MSANRATQAGAPHSLESLLSPLNRETLQALLIQIAGDHPNLIAEIEQKIPLPVATIIPTSTSSPPSPTSTPIPARPAPVDPASIRKLVRSALKSVGQEGEESYYRDDYDGVGELQEEINPLLEMADAFLAVQDSRGALPILEAITDAKKANHYDDAVHWVARARDAYLAAGEEAAWKEYKSQLLATHQRKYKLIPMLKPL